MPLAWYSSRVPKRRRVIHVCLDCGHEDLIDKCNMVYLSESDILTSDTICVYCKPHLRGGTDHQDCYAVFSCEVLAR